MAMAEHQLHITPIKKGIVNASHDDSVHLQPIETYDL